LDRPDRRHGTHVAIAPGVEGHVFGSNGHALDVAVLVADVDHKGEGDGGRSRGGWWWVEGGGGGESATAAAATSSSSSELLNERHQAQAQPYGQVRALDDQRASLGDGRRDERGHVRGQQRALGTVGRHCGARLLLLVGRCRSSSSSS
jgi:hypothetical protein